MNELLQISIFPVILTLGAFQLGLLLQKKLRSPIANPILVAVVIILCFMGLTGYENADYQVGAKYISWLMTPATICLAIPMYEHFQTLRKNIPAVLAGIATGAVSCIVMVWIFGMVFHFDRELLVSVLPKSVTTAIGVPLSQMAGGMTGITTAMIILTGIVANVLGVFCCKLFRLTNPIARGVAFGTAGHVIGTAKAGELDPLTGATSSLSLVVAGLLTAVIFPLLIS